MSRQKGWHWSWRRESCKLLQPGNGWGKFTFVLLRTRLTLSYLGAILKVLCNKGVSPGSIVAANGTARVGYLNQLMSGTRRLSRVGRATGRVLSLVQARQWSSFAMGRQPAIIASVLTQTLGSSPSQEARVGSFIEEQL